MPLPTPANDEERDDFISRCLSSNEIQGEFGKGTEQAQAVCSNIWKESNAVTGGLNVQTPDFEDDMIVQFRDVPVFDDTEHSLKQLIKIVDATNKRFEESGDPTLIIFGHTDVDKPEDEQPEIVGTAHGFKLGTMGEKNIIIAESFNIEKDFAEELHKKVRFGRRSIELYGDNVIDSVAILGTTRPRKNLGLIKFKKYKKDETPNIYTIEIPEESNMSEVKKFQEEELDEEVTLDVLLDRLQKLEAVVESLMNPEPEPEEDPVKEEDPEEDPEKDKCEECEDDEEKEVMRARISDLETKVRYSERKEKLTQYSLVKSFDVNTELEYVNKLDDAQFDNHLEVITNNYKDIPTEVNIATAKVDEYGSPSKITDTKIRDDVVKYSMKNKVSFDEAKKALGFE